MTLCNPYKLAIIHTTDRTARQGMARIGVAEQGWERQGMVSRSEMACSFLLVAPVLQYSYVPTLLIPSYIMSDNK